MVEANGTLIKMEGVKKVFYTDEVETHALEEIHLEIKKGTYISIAGPSGCGKSTLLSILGLLDSPTEGNYWLNGQPVANLTISERTRIRNREIGFIFQAFNLIGDLTVYENVELPLTYRGMSASERKQRVQDALERVGMSHRMKHYPAQLSGGQQQRVAVARAVAGDPLILLADEPTGNLDSKNGLGVMKLLSELHSISSSLKGSAPEDVEAGLAVIERRAEGLMRFMSAYTRLARLPPPQLRDLDVPDWVNRVAALEKRISVHVREGPPVSVRADADQLEQLLINLIRNAADAALETGGRVEVSWSVGQRQLQICVAAEGPGVTSPANLFVPFFTTKAGGSGIGLARPSAI